MATRTLPDPDIEHSSAVPYQLLPVLLRVARDGPLARLLKEHRGVLPQVVALGVLASLCEGLGIGTLLPLVASLMLGDRSGPPADWPGAALLAALPPDSRIAALGGAIFAAMLAKGLVQAINNRMIARVDLTIAGSIIGALSARLLAADHAFFERSDRNRLVHVLSTDSWSVTEAVRAALTILPALAGAAMFMAVLAWLDWRLFAVALLASLAILLVLELLDAAQRRLSARVTQSNLVLAGRMLDVVMAHRTIRLFGQQEREAGRFGMVLDTVIARALALGRVTALIGPVLDLLIAGVFVAVLVAAWSLAVPGGTLVAFLVLLLRIQPHAAQITQARANIAARAGALGEVEWLLEAGIQPRAPAIARQKPPEAEAIRFDAVSYSYPDGTPALDGATLAIEPGIATALIGASGAGKTTIVNLLAGLVEPASGSIRIGEVPLAALDPADWRSRIAVAGQDVLLLSGTIAENIAYGRPEASRGEIEEAAAIAGLNALLSRHADGIDAPVLPEGSNFSGGQRQRIAIARALLRRPELLILDEATNAVDALAESEILTLLGEHRHFRTALVISHRRATLAGCVNGIVIDAGRVIEQGPLQSLAYYRAMSEPR